MTHRLPKRGCALLVCWVGALLLLLSIPGASLAESGLVLRMEDLDTNQFPEVVVHLLAVGEDGLSVAGIEASEVQVSEDDRPVGEEASPGRAPA